MNSRLFGLLFCVAGLNLCLAESRAADDAVDLEVVEHLRTMAVKDWQALEREFASFDVTYTFTSTLSTKPGGEISSEVRRMRLVYDAERQVTLLRTRNDALPNGMVHQVANGRYSFKVNAPDMTTRGTLNGIMLATPEDKAAPDDTVREDRLPVWNSHRCHLMSACQLSCMPLVELLNPIEFEPVEAVQFEEAGQPRIRFSARYLGEQGWVRRKGGTYTIVLDPSHQHRLLSWVIEIPQSRHETFKITYHPGEEANTPQEIVYRVNFAGELSEQTWAYELPKPCTLADEEFYLPHYGFSEQVLETLDPNPWPRWLLVAFGIFTIALGAWLIRDKRERAA